MTPLTPRYPTMNEELYNARIYIPPLAVGSPSLSPWVALARLLPHILVDSTTAPMGASIFLWIPPQLVWMPSVELLPHVLPLDSI